jgi:hypothetical protein
MPDTEPIPEGMMRVWDPQQKKVILVSAPPAGPDRLKLTLRLHDPKEKKNAKLAASWVVIDVPREDLAMSPEDFAAKHIVPRVVELEHFAVKVAKTDPAPVVQEPTPSASLPADQAAADATARSTPPPSPVVAHDSPVPVESPAPSSASETSATETAPQKS